MNRIPNIGDKVLIVDLLPFNSPLTKSKRYTVVKVNLYSSYPITIFTNNNFYHLTLFNIKLTT